MPNTPPTLSGAGTWRGAVAHQVFGAQSSIVAYPTSPVLVGTVYLVTVSTSDATIPSVSLSDDDGSLIASSASEQPSNQAQWLATSGLARAAGGDRFHVVFTNVTQKGTSPFVQVDTFNPSGQ